ncbi:MAG: hypothetical protein AAFN10_06915 [Bacteroidota bacterium]
MKPTSFFWFLASFSLLLFACGDPMGGNADPGAATAAGPNVSFTATVDGEAFNADLITAVQTHFTTAQGKTHQFILTGEQDDGRLINFSIQQLKDEPIVPGTYEFKPGNSHGASYVISYKLSDDDSRLWDPTGDSGLLTIDTMTDAKISGTFKLVLYKITPMGVQDPISITDGRFESNNYHEFDR